MRVVRSEEVARAVSRAIPRLATCLPCDVASALVKARETESDPRGASALQTLCANAALAASEGLPICQDTGTVRVTLEVGPDVCVAGDVFSGVDEAVGEAYTAHGLRASVVKDALFNRENTKNNTPAFCKIECVDEPGCARLHLMLKGGGSDNACRVIMLQPSAGRAGVIAEVLRCVQEKAANACPPVVVGVGIGGTFDTVAHLATKAMSRPLGAPAPSPEAAALEAELTEAVAALGVGAGGQGGQATAMAVHVETAPCHIAALPLAIELGCSAMRRCTVDLNDTEGWEQQLLTTDGATQVATSPAQAVDTVAKADKTYAAAQTIESAAEKAEENQAPAPDFSPNTALSIKHLNLPLNREDVSQLKAGDLCLLTGDMYTLRDAGHARLVAEMDARGSEAPLPYGLEGATIFYAGPTPPSPTHPERPFGAVGPTTASRMDAFASRLYAAGVVATIGKGSRAAAVRTACAETGSVYFTAIGGAAALLGSAVEKAETVAYEDLGTEALRKLTVKDFPVTVAIDGTGALFQPGAPTSKERQ